MHLCLIYSFFFFFLSFLMFLNSLIFLVSNLIYMLEINLFSFNSSDIYMSILIDWMSLMFMSLVLFISSMVIFYSEGYMEGDLDINRFVLLVVLFVVSMVFLIISPNLISILLGWDGLGLVSYCLVIYYQNVKSANAGMLTALSNRVGDVAFLISIAWMLNYGSWNFIFYLDIMKDDFYMGLIGFMMLIAAMTKSAQIPFSSWLPAAMAAPTPVSSLVHSSTLVTAGVYLLIRFQVFFCHHFFLLFISLMTMFMAGLGANFEFDLKKIIALSTLSQLGLMLSVLALGDFMLSFFHLMAHALFKALLFMCAGMLIHSLSNCQDIRFMGSCITQLPLTCCFFNIANMALCGIPFLSGFYSKDLALEFMSMGYLNLFVYLIFYISIGLTVSYSVRLSYYTLFGNLNFYGFNLLGSKNNFMLMGMGGLIFLVIMGGSLLNWLMFSFSYFICLSFFSKILVIFMILMGVIIGAECFSEVQGLSSNSYKNLSVSSFLGSMWNLPMLSVYIIKNPLLFGGLVYKSFDNGWLEYFGSQNLYKGISTSSGILTVYFSGGFKMFLFMFVSWIIFL
nr:NADH dehydrogenase subunit 5 [Dromaeolus sp. ZM-2022]